MTGNETPIGEDDLQAFVDERLDGPRLAAVEAHLAAHPEIAERVATERRHRATLRAQLDTIAAEPIPARLRIANIRATRNARWLGRGRIAAAAAVIFILGASGGWFAARLPGPGVASAPPTASIAQGANAAYRTFVVEVVHPVEVVAAQEAHLLQWLSKRLSRPIVAPDLTKFGYRLMGGRLLPAGHTVSACPRISRRPFPFAPRRLTAMH